MLLWVGLAVVGWTVGYMVGGSSTPVVSVMLPLLFGLVPLAMEALKRSADAGRQARLTTTLAQVTSEEERAKIIDAITREREPVASRKELGLALIAVGLSVWIGGIVGGLARAHQWYRPQIRAAGTLPWDGKDPPADCPLTIAAAVRFVNLRADLLAIGYEDAQIDRIYALTAKDWCATAMNPGPTPGTGSGSGVAIHTPTTSDVDPFAIHIEHSLDTLHNLADLQRKAVNE